MARVIVTGGHGQLGHALKEVIGEKGVLYTDSDDMDITNPEQIESTFADFKPDWLVHCAAYTNVDGCEVDPAIAEKVNAKGTENLAEACKKHAVKMVYISTDYVFDGTKDSPYLPDDQTNPQSVYGKTKRQGEVATLGIDGGYVLRTSWLYGDGNNFVKTMISLSEKYDELKVVKDQVGRPTAAADLAKAIQAVIEKQPAPGIYHVTGDGPIISWADFSTKIFELAGKKTKVNYVTTKEYYAGRENDKIAPRPAYSALDLSKTKEAGIPVLIGKNHSRVI